MPLKTLYIEKFQRDLFLTVPHPELKVSVIVPVKNEAENLFLMLDALRLQYDDSKNLINKKTYEVLLLVNNSTDDSYNLAKIYKQVYPDFQLHLANINLPAKIAHVGTVRRLLMDKAFERFNQLQKNGIIVSTDGDSEVDNCWIHYIMEEMEKGNDVVSGRILTKPSKCYSRKFHLQDVTYRHFVTRLESELDPCSHDPWPRHFQCFGPSLAVTCSIYEKAGRLPAIPFLEDEEFRKSLYRIDARIRKSPFVKVYTSYRMFGSVAWGFSVQLQKWKTMNENGEYIYVESVDSLIAKLVYKNSLRSLWQIRKNEMNQSTIGCLAEKLFLSGEWLIHEFQTSAYFGSLWEKIELKLLEGYWTEKFEKSNISKAIVDLRNYFRYPPSGEHPAGSLLSDRNLSA